MGQPYQNPAAVQRRDGPTGKALLTNTQVITIGDVANFKRTDSFSYSTFVYVEGTPNGAVFARMNHAEEYAAGISGWKTANPPSMSSISSPLPPARSFLTKHSRPANGTTSPWCSMARNPPTKRFRFLSMAS